MDVTSAPRRAWALVGVLYTAAALVGVPSTPPGTVLRGALVAGAATCLVAAGGLATRASWVAPRRLLALTAVLAGLVPFAEGVRVLGHLGAGLALVTLGLTLGAAAWTDWLDLSADAPARDPQVRLPAADEDAVRELLRALPLDLLCAEWVATGRGLSAGRPGGRSSTAAHLRELLLDELERRDPAGVARWLHDAPDAPPDRYLRDDQGLSA